MIDLPYGIAHPRPPAPVTDRELKRLQNLAIKRGLKCARVLVANSPDKDARRAADAATRHNPVPRRVRRRLAREAAKP